MDRIFAPYRVPFAPVRGIAVTLYDINCSRSSALGSVSYNPSTGGLSLSVIGAIPDGTYYVAVKYNPASIVGTPITTSYPTVTYTFVTRADGVLLPTGVVTLKVDPK